MTEKELMVFCSLAIIAVTSIGFSAVIRGLIKMDNRLSDMEKRDKDTTQSLRAMQYVSLIYLKEILIKQEKYEEARMVQKVLKEDFSDLFRK